MTTVPQVERMSAAAFGEWIDRPENRDRWFELVRGEVIELPPPMKIHGRVCINVGFCSGNLRPPAPQGVCDLE